ncbi:MAG: hypothetical protein J6A04_02540 [Clostridia bacterium]|nr:hypothetical protein [Clostridia bacterium]
MEAPKAGDVQAAANTMSQAKAKINTGSTYKVVLDYSKAGLVEKVTISK